MSVEGGTGWGQKSGGVETTDCAEFSLHRCSSTLYLCSYFISASTHIFIRRMNLISAMDSFDCNGLYLLLSSGCLKFSVSQFNFSSLCRNSDWSSASLWGRCVTSAAVLARCRIFSSSGPTWTDSRSPSGSRPVTGPPPRNSSQTHTAPAKSKGKWPASKM